MSAFRLQTFRPASPGAPAERLPTPTERAVAAAREEGYAAGFLAGQDAATEAHLSDQGRLTAELVEAIQDAVVTNEAARRNVAATLSPALRALAAVIAPALAEAGIGSEIAAILDRAVAAVPAARPRLRCAPELAPRLAGILRERGIDALIDPAPELLPREAQIFWDQGYDHIDLDACVARVLACIDAHVTPSAAEETEDDRRYG